MATGMADSTVKVFVLSRKQHDVLTVEDMIREQVSENMKAGQSQDQEQEERKD